MTPEALFKVALAEHRAGRLAAAERDYRAVLRVAPQAEAAYKNPTTVLRSLRRWDDAIAVCRERRRPSAARLRALGMSLDPADTGAKDFRDTADIVAGLDLVISVDTSIAHLAASLGVPTWVLLPAANTDWRWGHDRSDSEWYPSVRLFRQPRPGAWAPVLDAVSTREAA